MDLQNSEVLSINQEAPHNLSPIARSNRSPSPNPQAGTSTQIEYLNHIIDNLYKDLGPAYLFQNFFPNLDDTQRKATRKIPKDIIQDLDNLKRTLETNDMTNLLNPTPLSGTNIQLYKLIEIFNVMISDEAKECFNLDEFEDSQFLYPQILDIIQTILVNTKGLTLVSIVPLLSTLLPGINYFEDDYLLTMIQLILTYSFPSDIGKELKIKQNLATLFVPLVTGLLNRYGSFRYLGSTQPKFMEWLESIFKLWPESFVSQLIAVAAQPSHTDMRRAIFDLLIYICPNVFGRANISSSLTAFNLQSILGSNIDPHLQVPFNFLPCDSPHLFNKSTSESKCLGCNLAIGDKDIFQCMLTDQMIHRDCLPQALKLIENYNPEEVTIETLNYSSAQTFNQKFTKTSTEWHSLIRGNFFQTELCTSCNDPIWGICNQGYICLDCNSKFHNDCIRSNNEKCHKTKMDSSSLTISNDRTRQTFENFLKELGIDFNIESKLSQMSTNQVKLIYHILHIQNVINLHSKHDALKKFWTELLPLLNSLKTHLDNSGDAGNSLLFNRIEQSNIIVKFIAMNSEKLNSPSSEDSHYESLTNYLFLKLGLNSSRLTELLIDNMASMGVLNLAYSNTITCLSSTERVRVYFPLHFTNAENFNIRQILYLIEGCLFEVNLSMNEHALIMLMKRCQPYYTTRAVQSHLMKLAITWFHRQDIVMSIIHKEFTSKKTIPPGILSQSQITESTYKEAGTIYLNKRIQLTDLYLVKWFSELQLNDPQMDKLAYDIYTIVKELCDNFVKLSDVDRVEKKKLNFQICENILKFFIKLQKSNLIGLRLFDKMLDLWRLDYYSSLKDEIVTPMQSSQLCKFILATLNKNVDGTDQAGSMNLPELRTNSHLTTLIKQTIKGENDYSLSSALSWLDILATAGLTIDSLNDYFEIIVNHSKFDLECIGILLSIILHNTVISEVPTYSQGQLCSLVHFLNIHIDVFDLKEENIANHYHIYALELIIGLIGLIYSCNLEDIKFFELTNMNRILGNKTGAIVFKPEPEQTSLNITYIDSGIQLLTRLIKFENLVINELALTGLHLLIKHSYFGLNNILSLIGTEEDFLKKLWTYTNPNYGNPSFTTSLIIMELANKYPQHVLKSIKFDENVDEKWNWLDSMLGLINQIDAETLRKYPNLYKLMGPLLNEFIGTLKSSEEKLRTKFQIYSKSITDKTAQHLFKLWGLYFDSSNLEFRTTTLKLMIYANNLFPKWPVIGWKSIFGVLSLFPEVKIGEKIGAFDIDELPKKANNTMTNCSIAANAAKETQMEEFSYTPSNIDENLKILVLTLAFQLIGHGVPITKQEINFLKLLVANFIGISGAKMVVNKDKEYEIVFDKYQFDPENINNLVSLQTFIGGIKKVLDNVELTPYEETTDDVNSELDVKDQQTQASKSIGSHFLVLILKIFNSNLITQELSHFMLKDLLEALAIIVYKYDIETPALSPLIIQAVKKISKMLTAAVSEENQHTILNICMIVLKRSSKLASSMLSSQIETMTCIVARLVKNPEDLISHKARRFLALAFSSYATNGLFILIFKNHNFADSNGELFTAFKIVLESADSMIENERGIMVPLRDQPIQDVINRLLSLNDSSSDKKAFENILANTAHYVRLVHSKGYGEKVLNDFFAFLDKLSSRVHDWNYQDLNMTYVIEIIAIVLKNHIFASDIILPKVRVFLKNVVSKFFISCHSLTALLEAVQKCNSNKLEIDIVNFANIILMELNTGLIRRKPMLPANGLIDLIKTIYHTPNLLAESEDAGAKGDETEDWNDLMIRLSQKSEFYPIFQEFSDTIITNIIGYIEDPESAVKNSNGGFVACLWSSYFWATMYFQNRFTLIDTKQWLCNLEIKRSILSANWFFLSLCHHKETNHLEIITLYQDYIIEIFQDGFNQPSSLIRDTSITSSSQPLYMFPGQLQQFMFILLRTWIALYSLNANAEFVKQESTASKDCVTNEPYFVSSMERNFWMFIWPLILKKLGIDMLIEDDALDPATCSMYSTLFVELVIFLVQCRSDIFILYSREWKHTLESIASRDRVLASDSKFLLAMSLFDKHLPPLPPAKMVDQLFKELNAAISP